MTAQTVSYLKNTLLAPGQGSAAITPVRMEDIADSFAPWDDAANASGLGAPAILRGTVNAYNLGLTLGSGVGSTAQSNNATILQAAINYCVSSHKFLELPPGIYEFNSSTGLTVPATGDIAGNVGFTMRGANNATQLVQYYAGGSGAPVLTVGDVTGATQSYGIDISGIGLSYGVSQSGLTSSVYLKLGRMTMAVLEKITLGYYVNPAYDGLVIAVASNGFFSNRLIDILISQFQRYGLNFNAPGSTSNHFDNTYINNIVQGTCTSFIYFGSALSPNLFTRANLEWGSCNKVIDLSSAGPQTLIEMENPHFEGITFTGADPCYFYANNNTIICRALEITNPIIKSANLTGTPSLLFDWAGGQASTVEIDGIFYTTNTSGNINTPFYHYHALTTGGALDDYTPAYEISGGHLVDTTGDLLANRLGFDSKLPVATFRSPSSWGRYVYGPAYSKVERAFLTVSTTYTHYGQYEDAVIQVPASITSFQITLAATMGATGTQAVRTGNTLRIRRMSGSASGTLTVKDDAGTTLSTNTTSATDLWYVFNGTHYVTVTPVTS